MLSETISEGILDFIRNILEIREVPVVLVLLDSSLLLDFTLATFSMNEPGFGDDGGLGMPCIMLSSDFRAGTDSIS